MRSTFGIVLFLVATLSLNSCSPNVVSYASEKVDFGKFKTYYSVSFKNSEYNNSQEGKNTFALIESLLDSAMISRSYTKAPKAPELLLRYELIASQRSTAVSYPSFFSGQLYNYVSIQTLLESTLLLEISDRNKDEMIWQASVDLKNYSDETQHQKVFERAMKNLFETYPYPANP